MTTFIFILYIKYKYKLFKNNNDYKLKIIDKSFNCFILNIYIYILYFDKIYLIFGISCGAISSFFMISKFSALLSSASCLK